MNVSKLGQAAFHSFGFFLYSYAIISYEFLPPIPHKKDHEHYAGRFKYLTYWNLIFQCAFFAVCAIIDIMKLSIQMRSRLIKTRDKMFASIALPYGMFVVLVFWILFAINRDFIFPKALELIIPRWLNHVSHSTIMPMLLLEMVLMKHSHPSRKNGFAITCSVCALYAFWVLYLALVKDIWPYPILEILGWGMRFVFFAVCFGFLTILYLVGESLNYLVWGQEAVSKNK